MIPIDYLPEPVVKGSAFEGMIVDAQGEDAIAASKQQLATTRAGGVEGLRVVPEQHRKAVGALAEVMRELALAQFRWRYRGVYGEVGTDPVSLQLAANMDEMLRRAGQYVGTWADQIRETHDALQAQLAAYESAEQRAADGFRSS